MRKLLAILVVAGLSTAAMAAATTPYSYTGSFTEDFDVMGTGTEAPGVGMGSRTYESYWDVTVETGWGAVGQFNDGLQAAPTDPSYGALNGGINDDRGLGGLYIDADTMQGRMEATWVNDTGAPLSEIQLQFDYFMAWARGNYDETVSLEVNGSDAGDAWDIVSSDLGAYETTTFYDPDDYAVTKSGLVAFDSPVAAGDTFTLTWQYQGEGGKKEAIGIDDLSIVPEPATMAIFGIGGVAALIRRRK